MLSRRRFLQLVASSIVALAARPKEVFASTGNIDGEQIQFTSEIAQELADLYRVGNSCPWFFHPWGKNHSGVNICRIAVHRPQGGDTLVILSVIDNLVKGAAGQAVQCMNLMFGLPETAGLQTLPLSP